ncbi:MAG: YqiA/YcfP family alpha/beta fold hydrolase [Candidatus Promineifilaceae bacterium]
MAQKNVIFLHGFASSGMGTKGQYLGRRFREAPDVDFRAFDFTPTPRDFEYMTITGMINRLRQFVLLEKLEPFQLIGSSFGALVGMNYAHRFRGVEKSLLLAPALSYSSMASSAEEAEKWRSQGVAQVVHYAFDQKLPLRYELEIDGRLYARMPRPTGPITIIHGTSDEVVPVEHSRQYTAEYPDLVKLIEVDGGHDLNDYLDFIWQQVGLG